MESHSLEKILARRARLLIHTLIISGTLNIALIATFATFVLKKRNTIVLTKGGKEKVQKGYLRNQEVLEEFFSMSYDNLVCELYNETHIEEGQRRCDLALACLAAFHEFDVERAFSGFPIQKREIQFKGKPFLLFAGISEGKVEGIRYFARTEMWPLTPKGLFQEIQKRKIAPENLREALSLTTHYFVIKRAFSRLHYEIPEENLFDLITTGNWEEVESLALQILEDPDGKVETFAPFLLPRMEQGSHLAAYLMVLLEKEFALKKLTDPQLETLISLLTEKTVEVETFLEEVKGGLRSDEVKHFAGKPLENPPRHYTVQSGDSLWKISRTFDVKVEVIQEMNHLSSETLSPGKELVLPPKEV